MPTFRHGKNTIVFVSKYDVSEYFNSSTTTNEVDTPETTTFGSTSRSYITGQKAGMVSFEGLWEGTVVGVTNTIDVAFGDGLAGAESIITVGSEGAGIGRRAKLLLANETSYEITGAIADVVSITAEAEATGGLDGGVLLAAQQAVTATVANASVDNAASSANGGVAHLHVTTNTRDGAVTVKVQHSANNSTWADLVTFTNTTAATTTSQRVEVAAGTTVNRYLRANVSGFAGSTGSVTITVGFARR